MRDSDTYMAILDEGRDEGRLEEAKKLLLQLGEQMLGTPDESTVTTLNGLTDLDRLERMGTSLPKATTWHDLLQTP